MQYVTKTFGNEQEADEYIKTYMEFYHPAGYGTTARKNPQSDGTVVVNIARGDSCD